MYFNVIASGSKGNCTVVVENNTVILIDLGIPIVSLKAGLEKINLSLSDVEALFFTHDHADHIRSLKCYSPKKMYALRGTLPSSLSNVINLYEHTIIGDLDIMPFKTSHDAINPCGYLIKGKNEVLVYMTDTGIFLEENLSYIKNPNYLIIESNHDIKMLMNTDRPMWLKQRILSPFGHLCNEDSAFACLSIIGENTKEIILAHLSEEANTPELALSTYQNIFNESHINLDEYQIRCANQWQCLIGGNYEN